MENLTFVGGNTEEEYDDSRCSFLLTYLQADLDKFRTSIEFSRCVLSEIGAGNRKAVCTDWACSRESHADGGKHYHMALQFSGTRRWKPIWCFIYNQQGISVDFALEHCGYVAV